MHNIEDFNNQGQKIAYTSTVYRQKVFNIYRFISYAKQL